MKISSYMKNGQLCGMVFPSIQDKAQGKGVSPSLDSSYICHKKPGKYTKLVVLSGSLRMKYLVNDLILNGNG